MHQLYCFNFTWAHLFRLSSAKEPGSGLCPEDPAQQHIAAVGIHVSKDNPVNKIFQRRSFWGPHLFLYLECGSVLGVKRAPSSFELYSIYNRLERVKKLRRCNGSSRVRVLANPIVEQLDLYKYHFLICFGNSICMNTAYDFINLFFPAWCLCLFFIFKAFIGYGPKQLHTGVSMDLSIGIPRCRKAHALSSPPDLRTALSPAQQLLFLFSPPQFFTFSEKLWNFNILWYWITRWCLIMHFSSLRDLVFKIKKLSFFMLIFCCSPLIFYF